MLRPKASMLVRSAPGMPRLAVPAVVVPLMIVVFAPRTHAADPCEPVAARIVSLQGRVEVQAAGSAEWTVAALEDALCIGDTLRVSGLSRAALALPDNPTLRLDQLTTLRLVGTTASGNSWLDLLFGAVHFFSRRPHALRIDTPVANAGTEGTEFLMRVAEGRTEVVMFEGRVRLTTPEGELLVASGDAAIALEGEAPTRQILARPRDAVAWALYYPPILAPLAERGAAPATLPPGLQRALERVAANDYAGAITALDEVPPEARDARYFTYRAGVLLNVGQAPAAEQALARALTLDPEAPDALAQRAVLRVAQNRQEEALADARRAVELSADSAPARIALSYALQAGFALEAARETLRAAVERSPDDALAWARLAELEQSFGALGAAQAAAERAVALAPSLARTQMVLGFAALTRIDIRQAKAAFERAIALDSTLPLARLGLGLAKIRAGALDAGARHLEIAVALDPNDSLLRSYLGKAYFEERRGPLDAEQFAIAKELDPNDPTPWFYDAIRLQTENRPVEALRSLERSIALNDERAPYRSRLLLDEDRATRGVSLGRIYDDLGFQQLGINEAARALALDPANSAAHRFLSDLYVGQPRLEAARVSELLQAQMLQPVGRNPIQPSLAFSDLDIVTRSGPARPAFNEFTSLFTRNGVELSGTGLVGNDNTFGDEVAVTGLYNQTSISAGQFHYETDGFRKNSDLEHNIYTLFGQSDLTERISLQAEYRHRDTDRGDRELKFNLNDFNSTLRDGIEEDVVRVGGRFSPAPGQIGLLSAIHADREDHERSAARGSKTTVDADTDVTQVEGQYLMAFGPARLVAGVGWAEADTKFRRLEQGEIPSSDREETEAIDTYLRMNVAVDPTLEVSMRLGYANVDLKDDEDEEDDEGMEGLTPGIGAVWEPIDGLQLRGGGGRTIKRPYVANQTLQPTQIAGFNELFDDFDGTRADWLGLGVDLQPSKSVQLGAEMQLRWVARDAGDDLNNHATERDHQVSAYLYWTPTDTIAASLEAIGERYSGKKRDNADPLRIRTLTIPLEVTYHHPAGWFATVQPALVLQDVDAINNDAEEVDHDDYGAIVDVAVGYRLPKRRGVLALEVTNLFDEELTFQDQSFRTSRGELNPRFIPSLGFFATLTLSF